MRCFYNDGRFRHNFPQVELLNNATFLATTLLLHHLSLLSSTFSRQTLFVIMIPHEIWELQGVEIYLFECSGVVLALLIYFACLDHELVFATFHIAFIFSLSNGFVPIEKDCFVCKTTVSRIWKK